MSDAPEILVELEGSLLGARARRDGVELGRLFGDVQQTELRGRHAWVGLDGHGLAEGVNPDLYRDLYAAAGAAWLEEGAHDHYVVSLVEPAVREAWLGLCFAIQQVHAARPIAAEPVPGRPPEGCSIRRGGPDDLGVALDLHDLIFRHLQEPPCWAGGILATPAEATESWSEVLSDPRAAWFLAERGGEPVGHLLMDHIDDHTAELAVAATRPEVRGLGIGAALTGHGLRWAAERGYRTCITDWRAANLSSSRFWPGRGFVPTHLRLVRSVQPI